MHETLQTKAYRAIRERLLSGVDPQGTRISDYTLSQNLGISRAPIREAMNRLVSERLLTQQAGLGVFVPTPSRREIEDLYQVREWLETGALESEDACLGPREFAEMERSCAAIREMAVELEKSNSILERGKPFLKLNEADAGFHLAILRGIGNELVLDLVQRNRVLEQLWCFHVRPHTAEVLHSICDEHEAVFHALKNKEITKAGEALRQHLRFARDVTLRRFDQQNES